MVWGWVRGASDGGRGLWTLPQQAVAANKVDELVLEGLGVDTVKAVRVGAGAGGQLVDQAAQRPHVRLAPVPLLVLPLHC